MEQILERIERQLEHIGTEQLRIRDEQLRMREEQAKMREDIAWIKGKLEGRIDTRTTIIAWAGVVFGIAALLLNIFI